MAVKPNEDTILQTYSLDELIDLVKEKAQMEIDDKLNLAKEQLVSVFGESTTAPTRSAQPQRSAKATAPAGTRRKGRPKGATGRGKGNKMSLGDYINEVMTDKPMNVDEIMNSINALGYSSNAKDPRRILYLELKKQAEKGNVKKTGRGMYAKK
jgi:hypothetical protein